MNDPFFSTRRCVKRLFEVYKKHKSIIIAVDFDETIYPYHDFNNRFPKLIKLLEECSKNNLEIIIFTSGLNSRHHLMREYCNINNIKISGINVNSQDLKFGGNGAKLYYNILLDDKAGLAQSYKILKKTLKLIKKYEQRKTKLQ